MKRLTVQSRINFLSDLTSSLINCARLNLSSQKLSIENQSLSDSSFCNILSSECWSFIYIFFERFSDTEKYEKLEMDTDSLYLALSEENLEDLILPEKRNEWETIRSRDCTDSFSANAIGNFFPRTCCTAHKKHDKREPGLFKQEFKCSEMLCLCSKTYCCYGRKSNKYKFSSKRLDKRTLEDCGDGPMSKYRKVLEEVVKVTSIKRGFRTMKHSVANYERTKRDCLISTQNVLWKKMEYILNHQIYKFFFECGLVVLYILFIFTLWSCSFIHSN